MKERESSATCNFTPSADGSEDYFVSKRKQVRERGGKKKIADRAFSGEIILLKAPLVLSFITEHEN